METAVPIGKSGLLKTISSLEEPAEVPQDVLEDRAIADLRVQDGWIALKKRIEAQIEHLSDLAEALEGTETIELIGFKFMASRVAMLHLQRVIDTVEATAEHVEREKHERAAESGDRGGSET